jgi:hypothetical protein
MSGIKESVKDARKDHRPVERDEQGGIGGECGERPVYRAVWRKVIAVAHLKACDHREPSVHHFLAGHVLAPGAICLPQLVIGADPGQYKTMTRDGAWPLLHCGGFAFRGNGTASVVH